MAAAPVPSSLARGITAARTCLNLTIRSSAVGAATSSARRAHLFRRSFATTVSRFIAKDGPLERISTGAGSTALQASSKPDYLLSNATFAHPLPRFDEGTASTQSPQTLSLRLEEGKLHLLDGAGQAKIISARWLRDHCPCPQCRNVDTGQRQINVLKGDIDCSIVACEVHDGAESSFSVTFGDGHIVKLPASFLLSRDSATLARDRQGLVPITLWGSEIADAPPMVGYDEFIHGNGLAELLYKIREYGFCFLDGMPATPEASEHALNLIGPIRNTHYGAFYDFTSDLSSKDTAYTSESLEPHNDNTYFTEAAGLQALHLLSHTHGSGGLSTLSDGFAAATQLYVEDKSAYRRLATTGIHAHASGNEGVSVQPTFAQPVLVHDPQYGHLVQVRWNNADRAGVAADLGSQELEEWYDAAAKLDHLLTSTSRGNIYEFQLIPGRMLIFDNWRALHGRTAFTGKRRMCGGYIERDYFISRFRGTYFEQERVRKSTVSG